MARINKKEAVAKSQGLPTKEQLLTAPQNIDTIPTQINGVDGQPKAPAALTEGEFVFSLPAIIALGEGDYDSGLAVLEELHESLREVGVPMVEEMQKNAPKQGLAAAPME